MAQYWLEFIISSMVCRCFRSHLLGSLMLFFVWFGKAGMADADIDSLVAVEKLVQFAIAIRMSLSKLWAH